MDYHFLKPKPSERPDASSNVKKILGRFLPVFLLAAILPFLIGLVLVPPEVGFLTRANTDSELRVWIEPANIIMRNNSSVDVTVFANFEGDNKLIPEIALSLASSGGVTVPNPRLTHSIPFNGKVELGKIVIQATSVGAGAVAIPVESIKITAFNDPIKINTGEANILVR